ncbi:MAG: SusC/RagA family TonB-linked outer membrane protein [Ginsengibacter sp.]
MKLLVVIMFAFCVQISAKSYGQKVSLDLKNVEIKTVLKEIRKQTGYLFFYKSEELENARKISINVSNSDVSDVMKKVLEKTPFSFQIIDRTIILKRSPKIEINSLKNNMAIEINGIVTDGSGKPLSGATVTVKGTSNGTSTGADGGFILNNVSTGATLIVSFVGYQTKFIQVQNQTKLTIALELEINRLDETVIIGYGTTSKRYNTGSVSSVTSDVIEKQPVNDPISALQGRVSGLMITSSSGMAGSGYTVRIRGENSIKQGNDPLYIIDGVPFISDALNTFEGANGLQNPLSTINPNDIARIDVLKDADATAIYGSRGANGVILITTKKGKSGDNKVSFNVYTGTTKINHKLDFLNTAQYLQMRKDAFKFDSVAPTESNAPDLFDWDQNAYTDWQKLLIGGTGNVFSSQASVSGGDDQSNFIISANYRRETSVMLGNLPYQKGGAHLGVNHTSKNKKFAVSGSVIYNLDDNQNIATDLTMYINLPPNMPRYNDDGSVYYYSTGDNPLAYINRRYESSTHTFLGNATARYTLLKGLDVKTNFGYTDINMDQTLTLPENSFNPLTYSGSSSQFGNSSVRSFIVEPQLEYNRIAGPGKINILAGASWQQNISESQYLLGSGYSSDALLKDIASATDITVRSSNYAQYRYQSLFGRINYNIDRKYIINGSFRRDGSSRFGPGKQFGNFGAVGAAWIFSQENFFHIPAISFGKLRASYGTTGNDQIGDYQYLDSWSSAGFPYGGVSGLAPSRVYNPDYSWEVNKKLEAAIDLGFFKDKVLVSAGYYNNRSSNQLVGYTLSSQSGFTEYTANLPAKVENSGVEIDINSTNFDNNSFKWTTSFNLSIPRNKLLSYPGLESSSDASSYEVGQSIRMIKGYHFTGIDPATGNPNFLDVDKDGSYSEDADYVVIGQTMPKFFGGLSNTFSYKNLTLDIFFQFVKQEAPTLNYGPLVNTIGSRINETTDELGYWNGPGDQTSIPRPTTTSTNSAYKLFRNQYRYSDAAWGDASYIRLKNVAVSYDLSSVTEKWKIKGTTIYVQGENLLTFTKYDGLDPEINGFDRRFVYPINPFGSVKSPKLPLLRTITVGLKFSL